MSTDTANIAGFQLVKQLPTHDSNIEYWIADDAGRSAEVYFVPKNQRSRLSGLPNLLGFTQCRIVDLETRIAVVMPGVIETPIRTLKAKLSSTDCIGIAWHIADLLSLLHQSGRAHNLLHPDSIGLNGQGQLEIRPALGRFIASDPDPKASAIATDCWQMRQVIDQLGITKNIDPLFALLNRGLQEEFARLRLQPATAIRQSISAVLARHTDWEDSFVKKMGDSWSLNQRNIQESTVIPHRLREMRPTMSIQELRELPDSIDLWGNLFTSSSVDETSSAQALLLEALANRQKTMPQSSTSKIVLPAQSELRVNEPIEKLEIDLQGPSSLQIPVQQPVRKNSDLVSIQEVGLGDEVSPALPDDEEDYFQGLVAIVEETAENLEEHHQRRRRSLSRRETEILSPMISVMPLLNEDVNETDSIRGIVEEYEDSYEVLSPDNVSNTTSIVISTEDTETADATVPSVVEDSLSPVEEMEDETIADSSELQKTQALHEGDEEDEGDVQAVQSPVDEEDADDEDDLLKEEAATAVVESEEPVVASDNDLDVGSFKEDVVVVSFSDGESEAVDSMESIVEEPLSVEEFSIEETVVVATVDTSLPIEKASTQSVTEVQHVSSNTTDESTDKNDLAEQKEQSIESDLILQSPDLEQSIEETMVPEISEEESVEEESEDLTGRVSVYNMPLVSIVEEMGDDVSDEESTEMSYGVRLSHKNSVDVQSAVEESVDEVDESEGVNIAFLMEEEPSVPISVERLNAVFEPLTEPSVPVVDRETEDIHRNTSFSVDDGDGFVANLNPAVSMSEGDLDVEEPLAEIEFPSIEEVHAQDGAFTGTINALFDGESFGNNTPEYSEPSRDVLIPSRSVEKDSIEPKWTGSTAFDNLPNEESALGDEKYALHQVELGDVDAVLGESIRDFSEVERRGSPWGLFLIVSIALIFGIVYLLNPQQEDVTEATTANTTMTGDVSSPQTALTTQVQIQTDPAQGRIYIDNVELGVAPLQWEITEGDVFLMCVDWKGNPTCRRIPRADLESDYTFTRELTP